VRNGTERARRRVEILRSKDLSSGRSQRIGGLPSQDWSPRVTDVHGKDGSEWQSARRHADPLVQCSKLQQSARTRPIRARMALATGDQMPSGEDLPDP